MTLRRVRGKDTKQAMRAARKKYPSMTVTKVNWLKDSPVLKGKKLYQVVAHKRKVKKK